MQTMMHTVEPTIYEFVILHCKPEFILQFYTKVQDRKRMYEKYGAKTHGLWLAEAGSVGTFYILREWRKSYRNLDYDWKMCEKGLLTGFGTYLSDLELLRCR